MQSNNYSLLIEKLDAFIRKYYVNQLLRGSLYTVGAVLGLFILLNVLEYYIYFGTGVRTAMLWGFLGLSGVALYRWVALPLMHYFQLGSVISHEQAAHIIGEHFVNVKDKLLNILQLKGQSNNAIYAELINASIDQKSEEIKLVPFKSAIDLGSNRKYLRYALPPVMLLLFLLRGAPNILKEGTMRLWNSSQVFEKPAPFRFELNTDELHVVQFSDFDLKVTIEGDALPNEVFIDLGKVQYRLDKISNSEFNYRFANVQRDTEFKLYAGGIESRDYTLEVLKKPVVQSFQVQLDFPNYIGRASESMDNVGDLVLPQGTQVRWTFDAQHTDELGVRFGSAAPEVASRIGDALFSFKRKALKDEVYKVILGNDFLKKADSIAYTITVVPDLHPQISAEEFKDSTNLRMLYFAGDAADDYGLKKLTFNYQIKKEKGGQMPLETRTLPKSEGKQIQFSHSWDLRQLNLEPGDEINYYFEIFDNDGVNGSKSARTNVMQWRMPTLEEVRQQQSANSEEIKKDLESALKESKKIQEELKKLRDKVLQKKEMDWQSRKEMERLLNRQKELQNQLEQAKQNFDENVKQQEEFNQQNEELKEKQEKLEELFEETMSEEMKKLMEDIEKLLEEMNKDEMLEQMEKMDLSNEELSKDLEQLEELYKQLEVENMMQQQIDRLEELAKEQEELAEQTEEGKQDSESLQEEQEKLNEKMDNIKKEQEELMKKNDELKRPQNIEDSQQEMEDIQKDQKGAQQDMKQGSPQKAGKKQKSASDKMKDLANKMKQNGQSGQMQQMQEDMATLRQILENLIGLSFNQESNMNELTNTSINTPRYVDLAQDQYKIKDDFRLVEDSLQALASRNYQMEGIITGRVTEVKDAMTKSLAQMEERRTSNATRYQQESMKGMNDLALLLSEVMNQMQQQMASMMPGSQSCQKPGEGQGQGKKPMDKITKGQQSMGQQMEDLKKRMEQQKGKGMSKEFAQMAAKQAALRKAVQEMQKEKQGQGKGSQILDEVMEEMDKIETDLVNKRLTNEMMKRQQEILTRLLEAERAEREQEQDEKRQAQSAEQQPTKLPPALEEYLKKRRAEVDLYRTVSPALKPYYKDLVEEYLKNVN
ncbi:MAG: DUF4175 family protein [Saprospiraceae bacterium]